MSYKIKSRPKIPRNKYGYLAGGGNTTVVSGGSSGGSSSGGSTDIPDNLTVTTITTSGNATVGGNLTVAGNATINGTVSTTAVTTNQITVSEEAEFNGDVTVNAETNLNDNVHIGSSTNPVQTDIYGQTNITPGLGKNLKVTGDVNVTGKSTFGDTMTVNDSISATGNITAGGKVVTPEIDTDLIKSKTANGTITVSSSTAFNENVSMNKNLNVSDTITTKNLKVTGKAEFFELVIQKIKSVGGSALFTPADGFKIEFFEEGTDCYYLYWRADDGTDAISNMWKVNDQALCQNFNKATTGTSHNVANTYWWALVTAVSSEPTQGRVVAHTWIDDDHNYYNYIAVSKTTKDGTLSPVIGDDVVMCGYRGNDDDERQSAIYIAAYDSLDAGLVAPFYAQYRGIKTFELAPYRKSYFDATSAHFVGSFSVESETGDVSLEDYINEYTSTVEINDDGYWVINGETTTINSKGEKGDSGINVVINPSSVIFDTTDNGQVSAPQTVSITLYDGKTKIKPTVSIASTTNCNVSNSGYDGDVYKTTITVTGYQEVSRNAPDTSVRYYIAPSSGSVTISFVYNTVSYYYTIPFNVNIKAYFSSLVADSNSLKSTFTSYKSNIDGEFNTIEQNYSTLSQTASSISAKVNNLTETEAYKSKMTSSTDQIKIQSPSSGIVCQMYSTQKYGTNTHSHRIYTTTAFTGTDNDYEFNTYPIGEIDTDSTTVYNTEDASKNNRIKLLPNTRYRFYIIAMVNNPAYLDKIWMAVNGYSSQTSSTSKWYGSIEFKPTLNYTWEKGYFDFTTDETNIYFAPVLGGTISQAGRGKATYSYIGEIGVSQLGTLYDTGLDLENKKITLTSDNLVCKNNQGDTTMWLDANGNLGVSGNLFTGSTTINSHNDMIKYAHYVDDEETNRVIDFNTSDNTYLYTNVDSDNDGNWNNYYEHTYAVDPLRLPDVVKFGQDFNDEYMLVFPWFIPITNTTYNVVRTGTTYKNTPEHLITEDDFYALVGRRFTFFSNHTYVRFKFPNIIKSQDSNGQIHYAFTGLLDYDMYASEGITIEYNVYAFTINGYNYTGIAPIIVNYMNYSPKLTTSGSGWESN